MTLDEAIKHFEGLSEEERINDIVNAITGIVVTAGLMEDDPTGGKFPVYLLSLCSYFLGVDREIDDKERELLEKIAEVVHCSIKDEGYEDFSKGGTERVIEMANLLADAIDATVGSAIFDHVERAGASFLSYVLAGLAVHSGEISKEEREVLETLGNPITVAEAMHMMVGGEEADGLPSIFEEEDGEDEGEDEEEPGKLPVAKLLKAAEFVEEDGSSTMYIAFEVDPGGEELFIERMRIAFFVYDKETDADVASRVVNIDAVHADWGCFRGGTEINFRPEEGKEYGIRSEFLNWKTSADGENFNRILPRFDCVRGDGFARFVFTAETDLVNVEVGVCQYLSKGKVLGGFCIDIPCLIAGRTYEVKKPLPDYFLVAEHLAASICISFEKVK